VCNGHFICTFAETYTVATSTGQRVSNFTFTIDFPNGRSCAVCAARTDPPTEFSIPPND
jgi:hypothetical protein